MIGAHPSRTTSSTPLLRPFTALTPFQSFHPLLFCLRPCSPQRQRVPNPGISTSRTRDAVAPDNQPPTANPFCSVVLLNLFSYFYFVTRHLCACQSQYVSIPHRPVSPGPLRSPLEVKRVLPNKSSVSQKKKKHLVA